MAGSSPQQSSQPKMHHDLVVIPDYIPHDTLDRLFDIVSTGRAITWEDGHYLEHIQLYVFGKFHQHPTPVFSGPPLTNDQLLAELKAHKAELTTAPVKGAGPVGAPPAWLLALGRLALQFLMQLLG